MDNRLSNLYTLLAKQGKIVEINQLAKRFHVSTRTIYNDINKLNETLSSISEKTIIIDKARVEYSVDSPVDIEKLLLNNSDFVSSDKQIRQIRILESILLSAGIFSSEDLLQRTLVSKNTLLSDLQKIKKKLEENGIELETLPFRGYRVIGDEIIIRNLLAATLEQDPLLFETEHFEHEKELLGDIEAFIEKICDRLGIQLSDEAFQKVLIHFWITKKRIELGETLSTISEKDFLSKEEQTLFDYRRELVELFGQPVSSTEQIYLANKLSEASITKYQELISDKWVTFNLLVETFITAVNSELPELDFKGDQKLYEGLINHLRPAYKRTLAKESLENPMYDYVLDHYCDLHLIIRKQISSIEKMLEITFSDHEISFFTLFFAASLERKKFYVPHKTKIVIICHAGISTSEILKSKIKNIFNVDVIGTFGAKEGVKWLTDHKVDLVITTISLEIKSVPFVQVNPYLSEEDISIISGFIKPVFHEVEVGKLLEIVKQYAVLSPQQVQSLSKEFTNYLNLKSSENITREYQPMLKEVLTEELIDLHYRAENRDEAVRRSGELLVKNNLATDAYIEGMIKNVEVNGTYIVIAPGIAMPHARPEEGALAIGFSVVTLAEPVVFGHPKNDPVKIVIGLCAVDHQTHLKALAELVEILSHEENVERFLKAKEAKEILAMVKGGNES
ncbi:Transcriptional antiterminator [Enterococcus malodoratus]|uniref:BglG family transcription antiterminator n=1 Tax=Enterococcus malodoratus TaxID=71451 RepID=UPI0008D4AFF2|nr:BglG family transcription antiterminator [Enterococcus malodoratus]SES75305.1 Transcriptional antiterminator [Enterococcus malodoratus]